jgi:hypothetical protein
MGTGLSSSHHETNGRSSYVVLSADFRGDVVYHRFSSSDNVWRAWPVTAREFPGDSARPPTEIALRYLGARRHGDLIELLEYAINRPDGRTGTTLAPLTSSTSTLADWTPLERAQAVWRIVEEGIVDPQVSAGAHSRLRRVLQAAFRLPDEDIREAWGTSLTERFKQLRVLRSIFGEATSTQPMEISWKHGVARLSERVRERLDELRSPDDWAHYRSGPLLIGETGRPSVDRHVSPGGPVVFRPPSEGAQKLFINFLVVTVTMGGRAPIRRISERIITAQEDGLAFYTTHAFSSESMTQRSYRSYVPTRALWGCRAEQVVQNGLSITRLLLPRPLKAGERAHFVTEAAHEPDDGNQVGWANVEVDHYGIDPGRVQDDMLPVSGLTIRISFDDRLLPAAAWWYAEQNEQERYSEPPVGSPRRLRISRGNVVKTFEQPCQPRENYGIAYRWD